MSLNEQLATLNLGNVPGSFEKESPALVFGHIYLVLEDMRPLTSLVPLTLDFIELLVTIDTLRRRQTLTKFFIPKDLADFSLTDFGDWVYDIESVLNEHHKSLGSQWSHYLMDYLTSKEYPRISVGLNNHDLRFEGGSIRIAADNTWDTIRAFRNSFFDIRIHKLTRKEKKNIRRAVRQRQSEKGG